MEIVELHALFRGRVQGVGFRWTVVEYAQRFHLTGITKNLADGSVELFVQGPKEKIEAFLALLQKDPGLAHIKTVQTKFSLPLHTYPDFRIVY